MADGNPLVSIVIPTYNREKLLPEAIDSVLSQSYRNWELIVVDDPADNTEAVMRGYMDRDQRIKYVKNKHIKGGAGARNHGRELSAGEYIAFLDDDDVWKSYHLQNIMEEFARNEDIDWIYTDSEILEEGRIVTKSVFEELWVNRKKLPVTQRGALSVLDGQDLLTNAIRYDLYAANQCSIIRKKLLAAIQFDEDLSAAEDWLFTLEAIAQECKLAYLEKVHFTYRYHPHNTSANLKHKSHGDNLRIYREFEKLYKILQRKVPLTREQEAAVTDRLADLHCLMDNAQAAMRTSTSS